MQTTMRMNNDFMVTSIGSWPVMLLESVRICCMLSIDIRTGETLTVTE